MGEQAITEITPGRRQARFLRAVADHLDQWDLCEVRGLDEGLHGRELRVTSPRIADLVAWARSLGAGRLRVMPITGRDWSAVYALGVIGGYDVEAWSPVTGLPPLTSVSTTELEHVAQRGAPAQGGEGSD